MAFQQRLGSRLGRGRTSQYAAETVGADGARHVVQMPARLTHRVAWIVMSAAAGVDVGHHQLGSTGQLAPAGMNGLEEAQIARRVNLLQERAAAQPRGCRRPPARAVPEPVASIPLPAARHARALRRRGDLAAQQEGARCVQLLIGVVEELHLGSSQAKRVDSFFFLPYPAGRHRENHPVTSSSAPSWPARAGRSRRDDDRVASIV